MLGSYGEVYKCLNIIDNEVYAIKHLELEANKNQIANIANEINILKEALVCPYVVK